MAIQIPIYDAPQVKAAPAPTPQLRMNAPNLGAAVGQGLQQVAGGLSDMAEKARAEADRQVVLEKTTAFQEAVNRSIEAAQQVRGTDIFKGGEEGQTFSDWQEQQLQQRRAELSGTLTARQREMFDAHALPTLTSATHRIRSHEAQQIEVIKDDTAARGIKESADAAVLAVDPKSGQLDTSAFHESLGRIMDIVRGVGESKKWTPEQLQQETQAKASAAMKATVAKLLAANNSTQAQELLESPAYAGLMTTEDQQDFLARTKNTNDRNMGTTTAHDMASKWVDKATGLINEIDAIKEIDTQFKDNPAARDHAKAELRQLANDTKEAVGAKENAAANLIFNMMAGKQSRASVTRAIDALPEVYGHTKVKLLNAAESWYKPEGDSQQRHVEQAIRFADFVLHPEKLQALSDMELLKETPLLGPGFMLQLAGMKAQLNKPTASTIDNDDFRAAVSDLGWLKPNGQALPKFADDIRQLRSKVEGEIDVLQKGKGPMSREDKFKVLSRNLAFTTVRHMEGTKLKVETVRGFQALPEDRQLKAQAYAASQGFTPAMMLKLSGVQWQEIYNRSLLAEKDGK